jgi:hypothetical protein
MGLKRIALLAAMLFILGSSLLQTPGIAHAQTTSQATTTVAHQANSHGYNYFFNAGWWGWGLCVSHETLQNLEWGGSGAGIGYAALRLKWGGINPTLAAAEAVTFGAVLWTLNSFDRGNGVCVGWPYYLPTMPIPWSQ